MTRARARNIKVGIGAVVLLTVAAVGTWIYLHPQPQKGKVAVATRVEKAPLEPTPVPDRLHEPNNPSNAPSTEPSEPRNVVPPAPRRRIPRGTELGKIEIPRLHLKAVIREGTDNPELNVGAGHVPSTALPGARGNVAIAAHRDRHFFPLRNVKPNDEILVETKSGTYKYFVERTEIVAPNDVAVLRPTPDPELTLITCYPFFYRGHAPKRFIVHAAAASALSASRAALSEPSAETQR